jgi:hypothetical protein
LQSVLGVTSDTYRVLSFGCKSHLRDLRLYPMPTMSNSTICCRTFVRLCESTLKLFRSDAFSEGL